MADNQPAPGLTTDVNSVDSEPDFVPPDQNKQPSSSPKTGKSGGFKDKIHWPRTKKGWILLVLGVIVVLAGLFLVYRAVFHKKPAAKPAAAVVKPAPQPTTVASNLTGLPVKPEVNKLPVIGVMIENSPDARPQSGLNSAGVVFEAVAEGGITRFLTLFQTPDPVYVGPIRSARPYYLDWVMQFDGSLAHVGGSPDALSDIKSQGTRDLDQFANSGAYQRISTRYAPHNVYTTMDKLVSLAQSKGYGTSSFTPWPRKADKPATPPFATSIDISISGYLYNTHYDYDAPTNSYKRSEGGKAHTDEKSGQQITPKVLVVMVMPQGLMSDGLHTTYGDVGSGKLYVFQDGGVQEGTWTKDSRKGQVVFKDGSNNPLPLNAGQTWVTVVGSPGAVTRK